MSCFRLPQSLCTVINSILSNFWWGQKQGDNGTIHWQKWENLCKSKFYGEVDFRDFDAFNLAMLAKQAWRLLTDSSSLLFKVLKGRDFSSSSFLDARTGRNPSYVWRSLQDGKSLLAKLKGYAGELEMAGIFVFGAINGSLLLQYTRGCPRSEIVIPVHELVTS